MKKKSIKLIISLALGLLIFYFLFLNVDLAGLKSSFRAFDWRFSILAFGLYLVMNMIRALRFNFFLKDRIGFKKFLGIIFLYNFWNQILPFRSGELSYLYFVRKTGKVLPGENIASLVIARVFDLFILGFFVLPGLYFVLSSNDIFSGLKNLTVLGMLLILVVLVLLIFFNQQLLKIFYLIFKKLGLIKFRVVFFLVNKLGEALEAISTIKSPSVFFRFLTYSVLIWLIDFLLIWVLAASAGLMLGFWQAVVAATLLVLAILFLPIQTPANLGTYEGSLVLVFLLFGFEKSMAVSASLLVHFQNIVFAFIFFIFAYLFKKWLS